MYFLSFFLIFYIFLSIFFCFLFFTLDEFMKAMNPLDSPPSNVLNGSNHGTSKDCESRDKDKEKEKDKDKETLGSMIKLRNNVVTSFYTFRPKDSPQHKSRGSFLSQSSIFHDTTKRQYGELSKMDTNDILHSGFARSDTTSKLELFIVCRLGTYANYGKLFHFILFCFVLLYCIFFLSYFISFYFILFHLTIHDLKFLSYTFNFSYFKSFSSFNLS